MKHICIPKGSAGEFGSPSKKTVVALYLHLSIHYSALLLLPSLELWGPAHCPPDNEDLDPHWRYESTAWWSPQALWWIQCFLKHQVSSQYPLIPYLGSGLVLSPGPPRDPGHTPFSYRAFCRFSSFGKEHNWVEWQSDYFKDDFLIQSRKELWETFWSGKLLPHDLIW